MSVGIIIQARMGSSRLPGKILMDFSGKTLLQHILDRLGRLQTPLLRLYRCIFVSSGCADDGR